MRITFHEVNSNLQYNIMQNYSKLSDLQEQMATGRRLNKPSDDPVDVTNDLSLRSAGSALNQYKRNIDDGIAFMGVTDTSLTSMNDLMQRIKELGIQASNDTYTAPQRSYIADEVNQLLRQLVTLVDTTYKGDYVFGGTNTRTPPYTVQSGTDNGTIDNVAGPVGTAIAVQDNSVAPPITAVKDLIAKTVVVKCNGATLKEGADYKIDYQNGTITRLAGGALDALPDGTAFQVSFEWIKKADVPNTDAVTREIEQNVTPQINITADQVFDDPANNTNLVDAITSFAQGLVQNDSSTIRSSLANVDSVFQNILSAEAVNGSRMNRFDLTKTRNGNQINDTTQLQSNLEDADLAKVITDFSSLQSVYQASLKAGASIIQPSLMDYLK